MPKCINHIPITVKCPVQLRTQNIFSYKTHGSIEITKTRKSETKESQITLTGEFCIFARVLFVDWLPLIGSFLLNFNNVAVDLVTSVLFWFFPGQGHAVFVNIVNLWFTRLTRSIWNKSFESQLTTPPL